VTLTLLSLLAGTSLALAHGGGGPRFEALDKNKDGKITKDEAQTEAKARFAEIDKNKDGKATEAELAAHHEAMRATHGAEGGPSETKRGRGHGPKHGKMAERMFEHADKNEDGVIDQSEFTAGALHMFERMDDNEDGVVEKDELPGRFGGGHCDKHEDRG
jgi:Ca2+-binding EF-hand superfamily protein